MNIWKWWHQFWYDHVCLNSKSVVVFSVSNKNELERCRRGKLSRIFLFLGLGWCQCRGPQTGRNRRTHLCSSIRPPPALVETSIIVKSLQILHCSWDGQTPKRYNVKSLTSKPFLYSPPHNTHPGRATPVWSQRSQPLWDPMWSLELCWCLWAEGASSVGSSGAWRT